MAKAFKCDRCGNTFEGEALSELRITAKYSSHSSDKATTVIRIQDMETGNGKGIESPEICPSCRVDIPILALIAVRDELNIEWPISG